MCPASTNIQKITTPEQELKMGWTAKSNPATDKADQDVEVTARQWGGKLFELLEKPEDPRSSQSKDSTARVSIMSYEQKWIVHILKRFNKKGRVVQCI